jgi:hypothetical protein
MSSGGFVMGELAESTRSEGFRTPSHKFEFYFNISGRAGRPPLPVWRRAALSPVSAPELAEYPHPHDGHEGATIYLSCTDRFRARHPIPVEINPETAARRRHTGRGLGTVNRPMQRLCSRQSSSMALRPMSSTQSTHGGNSGADPPDYRWKESASLSSRTTTDPDTGRSR